MKKFFPLFLLVFFFSIDTYSQYVHKIKADSVLITNDSCNAELNLENSTKNVNGFLYNKGNGRTEFRKGLIKVDDTLYIIGNDTLNIAKGGNYIQNQITTAQNANAWINGKMLLGSITDQGAYNLQVGGDAIFRGPGSTHGVQFGFSTGLSGRIIASGTGLFMRADASRYLSLGANGLNDIIKIETTGDIKLAKTTYIYPSFNVSSGATAITTLDISPTILQNGTASGNIYGVYYNPTITSVIGTHYFMHANTGSNVLNGTSGNTRFGNNNTNLANSFVIDPYSSQGGALMTVTGSNFPRSVMKVDVAGISVYTPALFSISGTNPYIGGQNKSLFDIDIVQNNNAYNVAGYKSKIYRTATTIASQSTTGFEADVDGYTGNTYGIYSKAITSAASPAGTAYAFYGAAGMNYFSGNVGIGTLPTSAYSLDISSTTNAVARLQVVNGYLQLIKSNAQVASPIQTWARNTGNPFYLQYQNANTNYTSVPNIGTLNGFNIGLGAFVSTGLITGAGNGLATLVFDDQTAANNPNSLIMILDNAKRPMTWRKDGTTTISTDGLMGHYVAGMDMPGTRLKLSGGRSTGSGAGGSIEFYSTPAGVSGNTLNSETLRMILSASGNLGIGNSTPTARLHIAAGSSSAGMGPIKLTAGTNLSTPENGSVEYDGTNYFVTSNETRYAIARTLTTTSTLNFNSTSAGSSTDLTITLTGASNGDPVSLGVPNEAVSGNGLFSAWVSASNTVTVRFSNNDLTNAIDPASGTFRVSIIKY